MGAPMIAPLAEGFDSGETADDLADPLAAVRVELGADHDARAVSRLDGVAFLREVEELELLDVLPVHAFDGDRELLHVSIIARGCGLSAPWG